MMKNSIFITLFLSLVFCFATSTVSAVELANLMQGFSKNKYKKNKFSETRYAFYLEKPIYSEGTIEFRSPDILIKETIKPIHVIQEFSNNSIKTIESNGEESFLDLTSQPAVAALFQTLSGLLSGNEKTIKKNFSISNSNKNEIWTLDLIPKEDYLKSWFKNIVISGSGYNIRRIKIIEANDDMTIMEINEPD